MSTKSQRDEVIDRKAGKIGWGVAALMFPAAFVISAAGAVPLAATLPFAFGLFLLFGGIVRAFVSRAIKTGVAMTAYGRIGLAAVVCMFLMASADPNATSLVIPIVLAALVVDRLCGYVSHVELTEAAAAAAQEDAEVLANPRLADVTVSAFPDEPAATPPPLPTVTVAREYAGRSDIVDVPVPPPPAGRTDGFAEWERE